MKSKLTEKDGGIIIKLFISRKEIEKVLAKKPKLEIQIVESPVINSMISLFETVNPSYKKFFANINQRKAIENLLQKFKEEQLIKIIQYLPKSNHIPYCPTIISPTQLEEKVAALEACLVKNQKKTNKNQICRI